MIPGASGRRTPAYTVAAGLQRPDAAGERDQGTHSPRLRGAADARETLTQFRGAGTPGAGRHRPDRAPGEKGTARMPVRSEIAGLAEDAAITLGLQVRRESERQFHGEARSNDALFSRNLSARC